jgi:phosphoglucomutase
MSVFDGLQEIWNKYGASCEITKAIEMPGLDGQKRMAKVMENLRKEQLQEINGHKVIKIEDFELAKEITPAGEKDMLGFPKSNVLKYFLDDETWVALRPSGTEPVIKAYVGTNAETYAKAEEKCKAYHEAIAKFTK